VIEGNPNADILIVSDFLRVQENAEHEVISGYRRRILTQALLRAGIPSDSYALTVLWPYFPAGERLSNLTSEQKQAGREALKKLINTHQPNVIVPLGEAPLRELTGKETIGKWHLSILTSRAEYGGRKVVPLLHPQHVLRNYTDSAYISFGAQRIRDEAHSSRMNTTERTFLLSPPYEETLDFLDRAQRSPRISVDIETGRGQINTLGIALSPTEAIAINVLPDRFSKEKFLILWRKIQSVLEGRSQKIMQNYLYECQYLSRYGIWINNVWHCTMAAQKFLHPELGMGLDNVGRLYTRYPYWKEDGKDWGSIRNWTEHYAYNCKDTTGTFAGCLSQRIDLKERGLLQLFDSYCMRLTDPIREMCSRGLLLSESVRTDLLDGINDTVAEETLKLNIITEERLGHTINPRSPAQLKSALKDMGFKLPSSKTSKESSDKKSLIKMRKKYKKEEIFSVLLKLSSENKKLSSYVNFKYDSDSRVRYNLLLNGTETMRFAGKKDSWDKGFNPQTVPPAMRRMFIAEPGKKLIEIDLQKAESYYVAYEAPEPTLIKLLSEGRDIHKFVASKIFGIPESEVTKEQRQLGKKSGHAANYGVGVRTFAEACLVEMGLSMTESEAKAIIQGYFEVFPGIRRRQENIRRHVAQYRKLTTPCGFQRTFYDRVGDSMFREAYAYAPQSVVPFIINKLMLHIEGHTELILQVHDSVLCQSRTEDIPALVKRAQDLAAWHPEIILPGGKLVIPIDIKVGDNWGEMT